MSGKPRPWLVVQSDAFNDTHASVTVCMLSSTADHQPLFRVAVEPSEANGLKEGCIVMVDVVLTIARRSVDRVIGRIEDEIMITVDQALRRWLAL